MLSLSSKTCASGTLRRPAVPPRGSVSTSAFDLSKVGVCTLAATLALSIGLPAHAEFRLPPIDSDPKRCERGFVGNTIGQANAVSDKILDLRKCNFIGADLSTKVLSGALLANADLSRTNMREAVLTKAYAVDANFQGADMSNAVVDRVNFNNANLRDVVLVNAVVTGATFEGADLTGSVWEDALVGNEDVKRLCSNPTLVGESRDQVGCRRY